MALHARHAHGAHAAQRTASALLDFFTRKMNSDVLWPLWSNFTKSRSELGLTIRVNFIVALLFLGQPQANAKVQEPTGVFCERLVSGLVDARCAVPAQTRAGSLCGTLRASYQGRNYASFRGVPYARQPIGDLRFAAPEPGDPWDGFFNASAEGPVCPQGDLLIPMLQPRSMGEDCLRANVHVPVASLPKWGKECRGPACLPVLVFVHGGAFHSGSGDSDMHGPEYMMDYDVVLITLNYRVGPFGFLSLNSSSVPGNAGLRDIIRALQWVQTNARAFGGDPGRVTLMGQSAGAALAHILSLSPAASGLFQTVILMSGTAISGYFSTQPSFAQYVKNSFLKQLGINSTDADGILSQLKALPYQALVDANNALLETTGFTAFCPVVESQFDGVTRIVENDPEVLLALGRGNNYPMLVGFVNNECGAVQHTLEKMNVVENVKKNAIVLLPAKLLYSVSPEEQTAAGKQMMDRYFHGTPTLNEYIPSCSESLFVYPALKLAEARLTTGGAPFYLYQFAYGSPSAPTKLAYGIQYKGAGHLDDLSYVLRVNSMLNNTLLSDRDEEVKDWLTHIIANFVVHHTEASCQGLDDSLLWPGVSRENGFQYQAIRGSRWAMSPLTRKQRDMMSFYDRLYGVKTYSGL